MNTITNMDDVIDSRDIIERIEELNGELEACHDEQESTLSFEYALQDVANFPGMEEEYNEWKTLSDIAEECKQYSSDWEYGETLIRRSYFEEYMDEMIEDGYTLPEDLPCWMSIKLDYAALEQDYTGVDFGGVEYLIRSV